jgi:hypothetical protein
MNIQELATLATQQLLIQSSVVVVHSEGWERNGFPLPIKRVAPDSNGTTTQEYRPMAILEYVQEVLSGEVAKRRIRDRKAEKETA